MTVPGNSGELASRTRRTLRFRLPLFVALAFNGVLLIRAPLAEALLSDAPPKADPSLVTASARETEPRAALGSGEVQPSVAGSVEPAESARPQPARIPSIKNSADPSLSPALPPGAALTEAADSQAAPTEAADAGPHDRGAKWTGFLDFDSLELMANRLEEENADALLVPARAVANVPRHSWDLLARRWLDAVNHVAESRELRLHNPLRNGGVIHVLVGETRLSLPAGTSYIVRGETRWTIRYHRGDSLGNASHECGPGNYEFEVGDQGWILVPAPLGSSRDT